MQGEDWSKIFANAREEKKRKVPSFLPFSSLRKKKEERKGGVILGR